MRGVLLALCCCALAACMTTRSRTPAAPPFLPAPWITRTNQLQQAASWKLDGRAAVAVGTQGWQATIDWSQRAGGATLHLAGPLGVGAVVIEQTPVGLSVNGAAPSEAMAQQLEQRLGFELPLQKLRYWLLGVPDPDPRFPAVMLQNDQDRLQQLIQAGWTVTYERYKPENGDILPVKMALARDGVRVRIAVDTWDAPQ